MTVSGSFDMNSTVTELIDRALGLCGKRSLGQTTPAEVSDMCRVTFNLMIQLWQTQSIGLWLIDDIALFLAKDTQSMTTHI